MVMQDNSQLIFHPFLSIAVATLLQKKKLNRIFKNERSFNFLHIFYIILALSDQIEIHPSGRIFLMMRFKKSSYKF
jgi:hypothetical protein